MQLGLVDFSIIFGMFSTVMGAFFFVASRDTRNQINETLLSLGERRYLTEQNHRDICQDAKNETKTALAGIKESLVDLNKKLLAYHAELSTTTRRVVTTINAVHGLQKQQGLPQFDADSPFI